MGFLNVNLENIKIYMIESSESDNLRFSEGLKSEVLRFLDSRGRIKAALLYKLENYFCNPKSKYHINKDILFKYLFNMMKERIIDIRIPELFRVKWKKRNLKNLKFLKDGTYFCRTFTKFKSRYLYEYQSKNYYFDSRKINHKDDASLVGWRDHLKLILKKIKDLNKKIIIFYPLNSNPIDIYEKKFIGNYHLNSFDFYVEKKESEVKKLEISLEQQAEDVAIIKAYRSKYVCFYIPLIDSILKVIEDLQKEKECLENFREILDNYIKKFAYQCIEFVRSDYVEINEPNPYRWETFFKFFNLDIKILSYNFKSIKFNGRTFDTYNQLKYCYYIDKDSIDIIKKLKKIGYDEFPDEKYENKIAIGLDLEFYFPCSTIEHIYFLSKYVCYYHLFLLFNHVFEYIRKINPNIKFSYKEQNLYKIFSPVMQELFDIQDDTLIYNKFVFKYYTYDSNELELIYNIFLLKNVKFIEKKMFSYFFIKYGQYKD